MHRLQKVLLREFAACMGKKAEASMLKVPVQSSFDRKQANGPEQSLSCCCDVSEPPLLGLESLPNSSVDNALEIVIQGDDHDKPRLT